MQSPKRHRLAGWMGFSSAIRLPWQRISCNEEIIEAPSRNRLVHVVF
nr:hypothetical protein Iba_chr10cCG0570 [Ipomoea batatas]